MTEADRYPANVFWSDEDEGFIAIAPDLPGCSAFGETQSKALRQLHDAIAAWIEAARRAGNAIPEPSRPTVDAQPSGKLLVRMPRSLHAGLVQDAKRDGVSLNHYVVYLLTTARATRDILQQAKHLLTWPLGAWPAFRIVAGPGMGITHEVFANPQPIVTEAGIMRSTSTALVRHRGSVQ